MNRRYDYEIFNDPQTFKDVCRRNKFNQLIKNHNLKQNPKQHRDLYQLAQINAKEQYTPFDDNEFQNIVIRSRQRIHHNTKQSGEQTSVIQSH
jgi:hypothetical protein